MKNKEEDWLCEVWRIKRELSKVAREMGLKEYLDFAEKEAQKIFTITKKNSRIRVKEKKQKDYGEK